jgi:CRP-like cAMP-binding protein
MQQLLSIVKTYAALSPETEDAINNSFTKITTTKNEILLKENQLCRHLYFMETGALRGYYNFNGKEITHWFAFENDFFTSFHSFITQTPSVENLQILEAGTLCVISKNELNKLINTYPIIDKILRIAYEKYYIRLEERYVNGQFKTAKELYDNLMQTQPHILERMPLGYIASYLGITQETLSRIRGKY